MLDEVSGVTDAELVSQLEKLIRADRSLSAKLLVHLGEVHARKLYCERGYSSMFAYCQSALGTSEGETALRLLAAKVGRKFPLVVERLGTGDVHLTAIKLLAPVLTQDNHVELVDRARRMTKRQIEVLVADLEPKPSMPARIRKLPERRGLFESNTAAPIPEQCRAALATADSMANVVPPIAAASNPPELPQSAAHAASSVAPFALVLQSPRPRATSTPLGRGRHELKVTLSEEAQSALDQLVELFRHQNPRGDLTPIVERPLVELLETKRKQRFGHTHKSKPRVTRAAASAEPKAMAKSDPRSAKSRHIPRAVLREVHTRDNGQCTFVSSDGRRCTERGFLEVHHHHTTFARGGEATTANLRLTCRAHNLFFAEQDYGRVFMQKKLREARDATRACGRER